MLLLQQIEKEIEQHKVISFDIFDTLLLRPYLQPTDMFLHIEQVYKAPFFKVLRCEAEKTARLAKTDAEDVTYDEIYAQIDKAFMPLKPVELDFEKMVLRANPELKQVYDYAVKLGKKIIAVSDMYLPSDFLAEILKKNGFEHFDAIYVSGDVGKTKSSGNLYRYVLAEWPHVKPVEFLHIGDNKKADFKIPRELGWGAVYYQQVAKRYIQECSRLKSFKSIEGKSLGLSIIIGMMAYRWQQERCGLLAKGDYWSELGYCFGGPVAYGYSRFVESEAIRSDLAQLLFVARDGYILQKVFNTFNSTIDNAYVYAPRFLNLICRLDYARKNRQQSSAIIEFFAQQSSQIKHLAEAADLHTAEKCHQFIQQNTALFAPLAGQLFDNYKRYLHRLVHKKGTLGIVDTRTGEFSSQKLIQNSVRNDTYGVYWSVINMKFQGVFRHGCYVENRGEGDERADVFTSNWNFVEFLITSPEYPIKNLSAEGLPVYDEHPHPCEVERVQIYPSVAEGILAFAQDVKERFGGNDIFLDAQTVIAWLNNFIAHPQKEDITQMMKIKFGIDSNHTDYVPLFAADIPWWDFFLHPGRTAKILKKMVWRTKWQTVAICALKPLSLRRRGLNYIKLVLFPRLKRRYFEAKISVSDTCGYEFVVGNIEER